MLIYEAKLSLCALDGRPRMYTEYINGVFSPNKKRKSLEEPTEWSKIRKYQLFYGDIRTNTKKKIYMLTKIGTGLGKEIWRRE